MLRMLSVPIKKTGEAYIINQLNAALERTYKGLDGSKTDYFELANEFWKQREDALQKFYEKNESSLEVVYAYYDQVCALESKISVNGGMIPFKWKDAFDKGSIFGGKPSLTQQSLLFEKVCILFNIAALQSDIAASQSFEQDDGLKLALKLFQMSAGIFQYLKGAVPGAISSEPTPDLNHITLNALSGLMLAQAQEVFVLKAIKDGMNDQIIAKVCCQCEELYAEVARITQNAFLRNLWDKEWISLISGKQAAFHAMTNLYQSLVCNSKRQIGEQIARLQSAVEMFKTAQTRAVNPTFFEEYANRARKNLAQAKKDNEFIYNDIIPDITSLSSPGKAPLAKALPLPSPMSTKFKDIFVDLIPADLHRALMASEARKNELVQQEIGKLREATSVLNGTLSNLNLPAAIETTDSSSGLPPSILEKANDVRAKGGVDSINGFIKELPESLQRNREILDATEKLLDEENETDNQLRAQFKERWNRTPSSSLNATFKSHLDKYRQTINSATTADTIVRKKLDDNLKGIELLSLPTDELQQAIPSSSGNVNQNCSSVQKLKSLMEEVEALKVERETIESDLKSATINMKEQFIQALADDGAIDEPSLSLASIGRVLGPLQTQVKESIERQESLIANIIEAHTAFVAQNGSGDNSRDALYSELATAYNAFRELLHNVKEGAQFYNDLTHLLVVLQTKISDYCFARKAEKEELLKSLTAESSRQALPPAPKMPAHYPTTTTTDSPSTSVQVPPNIPYPTQVQGMPMPHGAFYPPYMPAPMPQAPMYGTMPYPSSAFMRPDFYGTYPGGFAHQQGGYPNQKPPG